MNILITGANGQLGCSLRRLVATPAEEHQISAKKERDVFFFTDVSERPGYPTIALDITDLEEIYHFIRNYNIDIIINCAAYTNVDAAESNEPLAEKLNSKAVENLATAMKEINGWLVHISTDYVFGGDPYNTPCKEDQKGTPTGVYGLTKLHGEQAVERVGCKFVILRTAWLYSEYGKNFVKTMLNLTATKPQLKVVFDQAGTPTYATDLASTILAIIHKPVQGIYHYSNEGVCSWYDFTKMIQQIAVEIETPETTETFGTHGVCEVLPCHSDEFPSLVKRPAYSVLDKTKLKETFGIKIPYWTDSLSRCIKNIKYENTGVFTCW